MDDIEFTDYETDELNQKITEIFNTWVTDVNSVDIPVLVSDEQAVAIIKAGLKRRGMTRRMVNWILSKDD